MAKKHSLSMDTEVSVKVDVTEHLGNSFTVRIEALSTDHDISRVVLWAGGTPKAPRICKQWKKSDATLKNTSQDGVAAPKSDDTAKDPNIDAGWVKKDDVHSVEVQTEEVDKDKAEHLNSTDFPVLVDVYEEGVKGGEPADAHRHGWFGKDGALVKSKKHPIGGKWSPPLTPENRNHWYGRWSEDDKAVGEGLGDNKDLPEPPTFNEDDK